MILVVNINLAVDYIIQVDDLQLGQVHRSKSTLRQAGGKGVNVARVLKSLGERSTVCGFLGGHPGTYIAEQLRTEGLEFKGTQIANESRTCLILSDDQNHQQTVINEPGPAINNSELNLFMEDYVHLLKDSELIIITGSLPRSLPENTYANLISSSSKQGKHVLLDSSSEALSHAIRAQPLIVKINHSEAGELLNQSITDFATAAEATDQLRAFGAVNAMITLGAQGALLNFEGVKYRLIPPPVRARNSVGSGDAVMAGLAAGLRQGLTARQIGTLAMAAGAANALHGGGYCTAEEISLLQPQVLCSVEDI